MQRLRTGVLLCANILYLSLTASFAPQSGKGARKSCFHLFRDIPSSGTGYFVYSDKVTKPPLGDTPKTPK